ncbi:DUF4190 domain-containing protein [Streptomyces sp. NRRL S-1824]|uniref:DUF4190 domain-containing protein n=1 Tax=Streptomyces sp. NRRL S-1824 TaxID=1463889 RepID=UPI000691BD96|nr:DUF4190 domain-containing protein [Streptomyces sp. NRRL S-1824]
MADTSGAAGGTANTGDASRFAPGIQPAYGHVYPGNAPLPSGKATASMVLGILGLLLIPIVLPIIALCLGVSARRMADRGEGGGRGQATAGMVMGIVGCVFAGTGFVMATVQAIWY